METFKIKSFRETKCEPDIECSVTIDDKGNVTSQYQIIERKNDCAIMLPIKEYIEITGRKPYPETKLVPVGTQYSIYKKILVKAALLRREDPKNIHIKTSEEFYYENNKEKIELKKAAEIKEKKQKKDKEAKRVSDILELVKKTGKRQIIYKYSDECDETVDSCDIDNILVYANPNGIETEERHHCY